MKQQAQPALVEVDVARVIVNASSLRAQYTTNAPSFLPSGELLVEYPLATHITEDDIEQILSGVFLPMAALSGPVTITFPFEAKRKDYWQEYLGRFDQLSKEITWRKRGVLDVNAGNIPPHERNGEVGLLFGGGVESLFGASVLRPLNPKLFALVGPTFMNNDHTRSDIKRNLEDRFEADLGLNIYRISTNARALLPKMGDEVINKFAMGTWFYFFIRPLLRDFGIHTLYKITEYESASNFTDYDLSLSPRFIPKITDGPLFLSLFNAYPKIQMFDELAQTPFFDYLYSCLNNTPRRWCGTCGKCRRLAEYGRRLGIDTRRIDLDPTIPYIKETSPIGKNYAVLMETFKPRRSRWSRLRELVRTKKRS